MPWAETEPMKERARFIADVEGGLYSMTELCERYGISRRTGYKWLERYEARGPAGLVDRSRAPGRCPHRVDARIATAIVEVRRAHPSWGPRKLRAWLEERRPDLILPAPSTIGDLLTRRGLVPPRRRRRHWQHPGPPAAGAAAANDLWTTDFKGQFPTRDGRYCYPLTIVDHHSRYLLGCTALTSVRAAETQPVFERLFREVGLPAAIQSDNGTPFCSVGLHGLSALNVWWIRLGIRHVRSQPSHPEQNGAHERMHRTLKAETTRPPALARRGQQRKFDAFRHTYNHERPHEALAQRPPARLWQPSARAYPGALPQPEYPGHHLVRLVGSAGTIGFRGHQLFLSRALNDERVGLEETADGVWSVHFCNLLLGKFSEQDFRIYT
jgi:transposase InsO family protein